MSLMCKTTIEKAWLVTSASIFVLHRLLEDASPGCYADTAPLRMWLGVAMLALSFPFGGLALLALHAALFWCDDCRNVEFLFDWSTLLFAGYIQWFWVLPEVLRNRKFTLLDLGRPSETSAPTAAPADDDAAAMNAARPVALSASCGDSTTPEARSVAPPHDLPVATPHDLPAAVMRDVPVAVMRDVPAAAPHAAFDVAAFMPRLTEFDEAGLTALDKVLRAQAPAPASPSHVEAIFPRVG